MGCGEDDDADDEEEETVPTIDFNVASCFKKLVALGVLWRCGCHCFDHVARWSAQQSIEQRQVTPHRR